MDLVISLQQGAAEAWGRGDTHPDTGVQAGEPDPGARPLAIESEGIDFDELRKAVEHTDHSGPLLDIQTQTQHVHIAIDPHH